MKLRITNLKAGEEVTVSKGIRFYAAPVRVVMTGEYPHFMTFRAYFRVYDPFAGVYKINEHNVTVTKTDIYCGEAVLRRVSDGEAVRVEVVS